MENLIGLWVFLGVQAFIGILMFEWSYSFFKRHLDGNEERDKLFPAFRRVDVQNGKIARWKFYPGALFLPIRFALFLMPILTSWLLCKILLCCSADVDGAVKKKSCCKNFVDGCTKFLWRIALFIGGITVSFKPVDYDYTEYLGPNYKEKYKKNIMASTLICNHVTWPDTAYIFM